jgi:hypothetical protein
MILHVITCFRYEPTSGPRIAISFRGRFSRHRPVRSDSLDERLNDRTEY